MLISIVSPELPRIGRILLHSWKIKMILSHHITLLIIFLCLSSCGNGDEEGYIYNKDDVRFQLALDDAKRNYPTYFEALAKTGTEKYFKGRQVFGKDVECVTFENTSSIVIEIDLPMYCFEKGTDKMSYKL